LHLTARRRCNGCALFRRRPG